MGMARLARRDRYRCGSGSLAQLWRGDRGLRAVEMIEFDPADDVNAAVEILGQRRAAFDPVAAVVIGDAVDVARIRMLDVTATHAIKFTQIGRTTCRARVVRYGWTSGG